MKKFLIFILIFTACGGEDIAEGEDTTTSTLQDTTTSTAPVAPTPNNDVSDNSNNSTLPIDESKCVYDVEVNNPSIISDNGFDRVVLDSKMEIINYSNQFFTTNDIICWTEEAINLMKSRVSNVLVYIHPVGYEVEPPRQIPDMPFMAHDVVLSASEIETLSTLIDNWVNTHECIDYGHLNRGQHDFKKWLELGADASTMRALCSTVRVVAMGITPGLEEEGEKEIQRFLTHELYHAFQQDLEQEGTCRDSRGDSLHSNSNWMIEGGAHYFASFITGVVRGDIRVPEGTIGEDLGVRMEILQTAKHAWERSPNIWEEAADRKGAAALLKMVDKDFLKHEEIMDGSFFYDCKREFLYTRDSNEIKSVLNSWYNISEEDGMWTFDGE